MDFHDSYVIILEKDNALLEWKSAADKAKACQNLDYLSNCAIKLF